MGGQFVTYEIALAMKELGFNEECLARFVNSDLVFSDNWSNSIEAPLWQQAIDWFREKYGIYIVFLPLNKDYGFTIMKDEGSATSEYGFKSYTEAREQAILKVIELIKKNIINDTTK